MSEEIFTCIECGCVLPVGYRHPEQPSYCFMDYVTDVDMEHIKEVLNAQDEVLGRDTGVEKETA